MESCGKLSKAWTARCGGHRVHEELCYCWGDKARRICCDFPSLWAFSLATALGQGRPQGGRRPRGKHKTLPCQSSPSHKRHHPYTSKFPVFQPDSQCELAGALPFWKGQAHSGTSISRTKWRVRMSGAVWEHKTFVPLLHSQQTSLQSSVMNGGLGARAAHKGPFNSCLSGS